jgi:membrane protein DedA with SNARE-associated domain
MIFYALTTTLGSIGGCLALYSVGRKGGEAFLKKRFNERHIERAMNAFRRYGMLAIIVPSLLPPPMPFKIFVLAAGVARMRPIEFMVAVAIGRGVRYFGEGVLALLYGDAALAFLEEHAHTVGLVVGIAVLVGGIAWVWWRKRPGRRSPELKSGT